MNGKTRSMGVVQVKCYADMVQCTDLLDMEGGTQLKIYKLAYFFPEHSTTSIDE